MTIRTLRLTATASAIALSAFASAAHAQESAADDDIIVTGNKLSGDFGAKSGIPIERVPQSVQIVTAEEIIEQGAQSIGDLLRNVPSANAGYSRVGAYQSFSLKVRGFLADQMRNGIRQRYYEDVDASALSNIERVEVLKGPSGVLYGQSAVGGIVSIITKQPMEEGAASMAVTLGSYDQKVLTLDATTGLAPGLAIRVTGEMEQSGTFVEYQDLDRLNAGLSIAWNPAHNVSAHLVTEYVERDTKRHPGLPIPGTVQSNGVRDVDLGLNLGEPAVDRQKAHAPLVQFWVDLGLGGGWTVTPRFQYQEFNTLFTQIRLRAPQADLTTITRNGRQGHENDDYYIAQLDLTGSLKTGPITHKLLAGFEYSWERGRFTQSNLTKVTPIDVLNPVYNYDTAVPTSTFAFDNFYNIDGQALYLQDQIDLTSNWNLIGAVRHSWIDASSGDIGGAPSAQAATSNTIWQVGTTYKLSEALSVYAGYNTGFDVESSAGARAADGKPLKPEESNQAEIGLRLRSGTFRGSVSAFQIQRVNALTTDPLNPDFSINVGKQRVRGVEVEGEWQPLPWWTVNAGYAYLDGEIVKSNDGDQGKRIGDVPEHSITLHTNLTVPGTQLTLRGGLNHVSGRVLVN
ncbi:MAG TPA: TonB-dependent siderophore receptor, partial [Sphingomonadaceae bacterium]|nr:TonB-dependent siderophore receptor [Sphingomonadaceae bacterium]